MDLENIKVSNDFVNQMKIYRSYNKVISEYFYRMAKEDKNDKYINIGDRIEQCNRIWYINNFKDISIKELKKTHLCKNKFCFNCKKVTQAFRMAKYSDLIRSQKNAYHLVLTLPSVSAEDLKDTLKHMAVCFRKLYRIFRGLESYKVPAAYSIKPVGALRSLEITYSKKGFHPHYHVLLVLQDDIELKKDIVNKYSYSYGQLTRTFSGLEVYIQKLWECLITKKRITDNNVMSVEGYSCILDKFKDGDFIELFKYLCKEADMVEKVEGEKEKYKFILSYEHFKTLYKATYRLKQLQGYGTLYRVKDDFDLEELKEGYDDFIKYLNQNSVCESGYEYLLEEDFWKKHEWLQKNNLDHEGFLKHFDFVKPEKYNYISFKKYVNFVTKKD